MQLHRSSGRRWLGFSLACVTMLTWGLLPLPLKALLEAGMSSESIVWARFTIASVIVGVALAVRGGLPKLTRLGGLGLSLLLLAILGLGGNYAAFMHGLDLTTPAFAQVVIQLAPPLFAIGGLLIFRERFTRAQWIGFSVLGAGLVLFFRAQLVTFASSLDAYYAGATWLAIAAAAWAVYGLAQKQLLVRLSSQAVMVCVYAGCAIAFAPLANLDEIRALDSAHLGLLVFCGMNTVIAYGAFSEALAHWEASRVSAVIAVTPLATLGFAELASLRWPNLGAGPLSATAVAGAILVVAGSMITSLGRREVPMPPPKETPPGTPIEERA